MKLRRREFFQTASAGIVLPRFLCGLPPVVRGRNGEYHLHPVYAAQTSLEAELAKVKAGSDDFVNEKHHAAIAAVLAQWSAGLLATPHKTEALEQALAPGFTGSPLSPLSSKAVRSGPELEICQVAFDTGKELQRDEFLAQFRQELSGFSQILTADFQVTHISVTSEIVQTKVLHELVGTGGSFYREQRMGTWDLDWEASPSGGYRVRNWRTNSEQRSRAARPWYAEITGQALGSNHSYAAQLMHGVDYWRTVLDGACGIDIYGHNGVSVGDIDGDGFDDLYICQPAGLPNRLYRNRRDGTFEDITELSGTGILENTSCALFADFLNRGRQDLIVVRSSGPVLFLNEGNGKFRRKTDAFQFASPPQGTFTGAAAADYNRDGWLDIYFCLYVFYQGTDQYKYPTPYYAAENGPPNFLMRNNGDGTFHDVTAESGLNVNNRRYSFCCGWGDSNRDGWPDLYVVNDFGRKNLYRNNGDGTFTDVAAQLGVEDVGAGMSVCWFDYNHDGFEDLYVADMWTAAGERITAQETFKKDVPEAVQALYRKHAMGNSLFQNRGGKTLQDVTGTAQASRGRWSWSSDAWDFDHDGFPDLYVTNGMLSGPLREDMNSFFWRQVVANSPENATLSPAYEQGWNAINELIRADYSWSGYERNGLFTNNRDDTFSDVSGALGLDFLEDGRAFALSDFDGDGRQELFLKNRSAPQLRILKNVAETLPPAIALRLGGTKSNRDAIGALVTVETESQRQTRTMQAGSGFLSQHSKEMFFGVGQDQGPARLEVRWPSGLVQHFQDVPLHHRVRITEGNNQPVLEPFGMRKVANAPFQESGEPLPEWVGTWLLAPIAAPDFSLADSGGQVWSLKKLRGQPVLLAFCMAEQLPLLNDIRMKVLALNFSQTAMRPKTVFPVLEPSDEIAGVYNTLYRYAFDRHRDLSLPTSFLINEHGEIVKIYQGPPDGKTIYEDIRHMPQNDAERLSRALPFPGAAETFDFARNHLSLGSVYFQRGYFDQAEASFLLALQEDPSSAEANYGLGSVYLKQDKLNEARNRFEQSVKGQASYPDTLPSGWNNLGLIAARGGHTEEAIGYFEQALQLSPDYGIALGNLGNAYRQAHQWDKAEQSLKRALILQPDNPEWSYSLGMVYAQTDQGERAHEYLQKALKLKPDYPEALNNLGVLYVRTRQIDQAIATLQLCMQVAPKFEGAYFNLARVYALQGQKEKARTVLLQLLEQKPDDAQARKALEELH